MQITKQNETKFESQFGTWFSLMRRMIESDTFDQIFAFIKGEVGKGKKVMPVSADLFKSFELCDRYKLKAVMLFSCPYTTLHDGKMIADGVPLSCKNISPHLQSPLSAWYNAIEHSYEFHPDNDISGNIDWLLIEEHILMLNTSLTVEQGKPDSHAAYWTPFIQWFIEEILNKMYRALPIVLCGPHAQRFEKYINPLNHHILKIEYPGSGTGKLWEYKDCFKWINEIIKGNNGVEHEVQWMRKVGQTKKESIKSNWEKEALEPNEERNMLIKQLPF